MLYSVKFIKIFKSKLDSTNNSSSNLENYYSPLYIGEESDLESG